MVEIKDLRAEFEGKYNIDIDDLTPLLEKTLWEQKNLRQVKKDIQKRITFLTKTLKKWQELTKKVFQDTDVKKMFYSGGISRFERLVGDPADVIERIFRADQITKLICSHKEKLDLIPFVHAISPLNILLFNLAHLFRYTEVTAKTPLHIDHVNWTDIFHLFEYWRPKIENLGIESTKMLPYTTIDALRKRYEATRGKIKEKHGRRGEWLIFLDPIIRNHFKNRKSLDRAANRAWKRLSMPPAKE